MCTISLQFSNGFYKNLVGEKLKTGCHQVHLVPQVVLNIHLSKYLICQIYICKIFQDVTNSVLRLFNAQFDEQLKYCQFLVFLCVEITWFLKYLSFFWLLLFCAFLVKNVPDIWSNCQRGARGRRQSQVSESRCSPVA